MCNNALTCLVLSGPCNSLPPLPPPAFSPFFPPVLPPLLFCLHAIMYYCKSSHHYEMASGPRFRRPSLIAELAQSVERRSHTFTWDILRSRVRSPHSAFLPLLLELAVAFARQGQHDLVFCLWRLTMPPQLRAQ